MAESFDSKLKKLNDSVAETQNKISAFSNRELDLANKLTLVRLEGEKKIADARLDAIKKAEQAEGDAQAQILNRVKQTSEDIATDAFARLLTQNNEAVSKYEETYQKVLNKLVDKDSARIQKKYQKEFDEYNKQLEELARREISIDKEIRDAKEDAEKKAEAEAKKAKLAEAKKELTERKKQQEKNIKEEIEREVEKKKAIAKETADSLTSEEGGLVNAIKQARAKATSGEGAEQAKEDNEKILANMVNKLAGSLDGSIKNAISTLSAQTVKTNTRLNGLQTMDLNNGTWGSESYFESINTDIERIAGLSPYISQESWRDNLNQMVDSGIAFNLEQRSFLETIKDQIADTFNANDASLRKIIRIQAQDSTASRLGMEATMNEFLNKMYESTEYLSDVSQQVKSSLLEAESLMDTTSAVDFEGAVQKWLGSMYSVGTSDSFVQSLSTTLGQLASGQLESITNDGMGNLILQAANQAGVNITDALKNGLDEETTNNLLNAVVDYLGGIYNTNQDNKLLQQQIAKIYGAQASDLKALASLSNDESTMNSIYSKSINTSTSNSMLAHMMSTMYQRNSSVSLMNNVLNNASYGVGASIATNPILAATYMAADTLKSVTGNGIEFSAPLVLGTGTTQTWNVADLMKTGVGGIGLITSMLNAASSLNNINGSNFITALGLTSGNSVTRGQEGDSTTWKERKNTSSSGIIGNSSSSDIQQTTMQAAYNDADSQVVEAVDSSTQNITISDVYDSVEKLFNLFDTLTNGGSAMKTEGESNLLSGLDLSAWRE